MFPSPPVHAPRPPGATGSQLGVATTCRRKKKAEKATKEAQPVGWKAQKRSCHRYQELLRAGKHQGKITTAIARELSGFIWAIACAVMEPSAEASA